MEERFEPHQLHGLHHAAVADDHEPAAGLVALLGNGDQSAEARRVDEVDAAQIKHQGQIPGGSMLFDEFTELPLGIRIELAREVQQQTAGLRLAAAAERDGESGQLGDGSRPPAVDGPEGLSSLSGLTTAGHECHEPTKVMIRIMGTR